MWTARVTVLVLLAPLAAWAERIDVSNASITCNTVIGTASLAPPLLTGGTATATEMHVKALVSGCTVTGPTPVTILSGKLSGTLTGTSNECVTLSQPLAGTLTIRWKADRATPIVPTSSTVSVTGVTFGLFGAPWVGVYGQFSLGTSGVTGAFTGGDGGVTSSNVSLTSEDLGQILVACGSPPGLRKLHTGLGQMTLQ